MFSGTFFLIVFFVLTPTLAEYFEECSNVDIESLVPTANDCRSFIYCGDEVTSTKHTCPHESYYNKESGQCEIDYDNVCSGTKEYTEEGELVEKEETNLEMETSEETISTTRPICSRHTSAVYPHLKRCEYYYKCIGGYLTISRCNFFHAWDYQKEMCIPYTMVKCIDGSSLSTDKSKRLETIS